MQPPVLNLHICRPKGGGDERCWQVPPPREDQGNHSCLSPLPHCPHPPPVLVPDLSGLEPPRAAAARHLSTSVSALLRSSCRAERRRPPGSCPSRPSGAGVLARPAPTTSPAPDAVADPAAAADRACHSTAAHCRRCRRHCPHPQASGHPPTDHRSACRLRV